MAASRSSKAHMMEMNGEHPEKVGKVMHEFKEGMLRSSSGSKVKNRKQAVAIAMSEANMSKDMKKHKKKMMD